MNIFNKNYKGFTIAETAIVLTIIGFISILTVSLTINSEKLKQKKIATSSQTFYHNIVSVYNDILLSYTTDYNLENLTNAKESDNKNNNKIIAQAFSRYLDGELLSNCDKLKVTEAKYKKYLKSDIMCAEFPFDIVAGFKYNYDCDSANSKNGSALDTIDTINYLDNKNKLSSREIKNTCGYIIYSFKNGEGIYGEDLFVIGLGKRAIK